jgi:signal transduction histidine kinase
VTAPGDAADPRAGAPGPAAPPRPRRRPRRTSAAHARPRRFGLQFKIVLGLLVIAAVPLAVSAVLIGQIAAVAQNFASNEAARLRPALVKAQGAYRELVAARKDLYRLAGARIAGRLELPRVPDGGRRDPGGAAAAVDVAALNQRLGALLADEEDLQRVAVLGADGRELAVAVSDRLPGDPTGRWRSLSAREPLPDGMQLDMKFLTRVDFLDDYEQLGPLLADRDRVSRVRDSLPASYRTAFLVVVGAVVLIVTAAGILLARRLARRIELLADATRDVAAGNLDARVDVPGRDELAALSRAFNRMVAQLERDRDQILYLQKIGTWQDVARRLAHEIKNPLTPIQLAVQQCVSSYRGDDPRHAELLADTAEIVGEEIGSLRRLVDAFRSLGRLPQAELHPLDLAVVVDDVGRDAAVQDHLVVRAGGPGAVRVNADRLLLRRVLANLIENGIAAGEAAGRSGAVALAWRADADSGRAVITVDDEGAGVPADRRAQIFDPYFTTKESGTGLGLAIAKKIVLDHGGSLDLAADPAPTGGARFVVTLPLAGADVDAGASAP